MQKIKKTIAALIIFLFVFYPISFLNIFALAQEWNYEEIDGHTEWTEDRTISGFVQINAGATLVVKKGVAVTFDSGDINVDGEMIIKGTVKNPVKLRKSESAKGYSINVSNGGVLKISNADMSGAGFEYDDYAELDPDISIVFAGINIYGGAAEIQGCNFHDNKYAVNLQSGGIKVNRTKFSNNKTDVNNHSGAVADFRYNWWGDADGPVETCFDGQCYYNTISGEINFSDWMKSADLRDPVIIIPGIMGTVDFLGKKILDPILRTYAGLYKTLDENGYTPDKDLFTFPYEWRDSNIENAKLLKEKIDEIKQDQNLPKVDLVAHSMGGLMAREYIESDDYDFDIDQLITLGTPQNGSPEDYLAWEGGRVSIEKTDLLDILAEKVFKHEAKEEGFSSIFDYIHNRPMDSIRELLPVYDYLFDVADGETRSYPDDYPENDFLENLNEDNNISKLSKVEFDTIVGNLDGSENTVSDIRVVDSGNGSLWEHGYPENFDDLLGDHGLNYGDGDGVVPLESAEKIPSDEKIEINAKHRKLPGKAADDVFELLTGNSPENETIVKEVKSLLSLFVHSPIDIQIIAPDGKRAGKDFATGEILNEIEGVYYTGYDTNAEFLTVPDPLDGEYKILTQGTGDGEYKIEASKISEGANETDETVESTVSFEGVAETGKTEEKIVTVSGSEVFPGETRIVTIQTIREDLEKYIRAGKIPKKNDQKFLRAHLKNLEKSFEKLKALEANLRIKEKSKQLLIKILKKKINFDIELVVRYINRGCKNSIDAEIRKTLTEDLNFIKL